MVVTCTGGEAGSILNPAMDRPEVLANMTAIRREEMARAAEILGMTFRSFRYFAKKYGLTRGEPAQPGDAIADAGDLDLGELDPVLDADERHVRPRAG